MSQVVAQQIAVTTGGVKLVAANQYGQSVLIANRDASISFFIGPQGVSTSSGAEVKAATNFANAFVDLPPETELWAVAASGTPRADVTQIIAS